MELRNMTTEEILSANPHWLYGRTDRNGTRYFYNTDCPRCNGKGIIPYYHFIDGGVCFECGGTGIATKQEEIKVYTEAHEAVLQRNREKRQEAKLAQKRKEFPQTLKDKFHFSLEDGEYYVYCAIGNTYAIKDELKEAGFFFSSNLGWYCDRAVDVNAEVRRVPVSDVAEIDMDICWVSFKSASEIKKVLAPETEPSVSEYQDEIGNRIQRDVTIKCAWSGESRFGMNYLYIMEDEKHNLYKWSTSKFIADGFYQILGTVKEHAEYNGTKQTVLTRCSIVGKIVA